MRTIKNLIFLLLESIFFAIQNLISSKLSFATIHWPKNSLFSIEIVTKKRLQWYFATVFDTTTTPQKKTWVLFHVLRNRKKRISLETWKADQNNSPKEEYEKKQHSDLLVIIDQLDYNFSSAEKQQYPGIWYPSCDLLLLPTPPVLCSWYLSLNTFECWIRSIPRL